MTKRQSFGNILDIKETSKNQWKSTHKNKFQLPLSVILNTLNAHLCFTYHGNALVRAKTRTSRISRTSRTYIWEVPNVREVPNDSDFWSPSFRSRAKTWTSKVRVIRDKRIQYKFHVYVFISSSRHLRTWMTDGFWTVKWWEWIWWIEVK